MYNYETIEIIVRDGNFKKLETFKWAIINWENLEKTWSYLRRKYGSFKKGEDNTSSWVNE